MNKITHELRSNDTLSIGQLAKRAGISVPAIRFYEQKGLINGKRTDTGQRYFKRADIRRLSFIIAAKNLGFSLKIIAQALHELPNSHTPTVHDWQKLGVFFKQEIALRIARLQDLHSKIDACIGCGCLSLSKCHLYNQEDKAAALGPGPVYLHDDNEHDKSDKGQ